MPIKAECPNCKARFSAESHYVGKRGKCPKCEQSFIVESIKEDFPPEPAITRESPAVDSEKWARNFQDDQKFIPPIPVESPKTMALSSYPTPSFSGLKFLCWGLITMFSLGFFAGVLLLAMGFINAEPEVAVAGATILYGSLPFLLVKEVITLLLHLERNTRRAAEGIEQLTQAH
ncbi:MJ0042-type zinc finger domain-containing protein [Rubinisphaera italica]|uniref:Zinc finger/thioredoxin putative domain-containing protein n=1 Tax=Rubinisphaera italica TaxID=2527969 RepID=A0A5C5XJ13_9PLAN|nr:MJ0042-type zinc finger domain-containing protein [Rubinisphaera italica]TWT63157.1 hypothetical protein Pan54_39100 [Rubinisphaera italica]